MLNGTEMHISDQWEPENSRNGKGYHKHCFVEKCKAAWVLLAQ